MVKTIHERKAEQVAALSALKDVDISKVTVENAKIPLHAGAARYYRELGLTIAKGGEPVD